RFRSGIDGQVALATHTDRRPNYVVTVRGRFVPAMADLMQIAFEDKRVKTFSRFEIDTDYVYAPVEKISSVKVLDQPVVNLSVEGDESDVAGNVTAHNCTDYCPEFALEETVEYDIAEYTRGRLVWSTEMISKPPVKKDDKYVLSVETAGGAARVSR